MKELCASVLVLVVLGCGEVVEVHDVGQGGTEMNRNAVLGAALTQYVSGITLRDEHMVLSVLSTERLGKIEAAGGIARVMEEQAGQIQRAFGSDADFSAGFKVETVESFDSERVLAATVSLSGQELPKKVYFVRESGEYKVNLRPPQDRVETDLKTRRNEDASRLVYQVDYKIRNLSSTGDNFRYRATSGAGFSPAVFLSGLSSTTRSVFDDNCTNVFLDGTDFQGQNGVFWQTVVRCAYQWSGDDFFKTTGTLWACTQTCT